MHKNISTKWEMREERVGKAQGHGEDEEERDSHSSASGNLQGAHGDPQWRGQRAEGSLQKTLLPSELIYGSFNVGLGAAQAHE